MSMNRLTGQSNPRSLGGGAVLIFTFMAILTGSCLGPGTLNSPACATSGREVVETSCVSCHSAALVGSQRALAPEGVNFDTEADIQRNATKIRQTTTALQSMPPTGPLSECSQNILGDYLSELEKRACLPACSGRAC